jgi:hypothetical protein
MVQTNWIIFRGGWVRVWKPGSSGSIEGIASSEEKKPQGDSAIFLYLFLYLAFLF